MNRKSVLSLTAAAFAALSIPMFAQMPGAAMKQVVGVVQVEEFRAVEGDAPIAPGQAEELPVHRVVRRQVARGDGLLKDAGEGPHAPRGGGHRAVEGLAGLRLAPLEPALVRLSLPRFGLRR